MSSRKQSEIKSTLDQVSIVTAKFAVSGTTGGNLTGSWVGTPFGTDANMAIDFQTSGSMGLPSGSVRLVLSDNNRYFRTLDWNASFEGSGSTLVTAPTYTGLPQNYRIVKYGHNTVSGTFDFGFVKALSTGSAATVHWVPAIPADENHSTSMAGIVTFYAIVRNTDRNT